MPHHFRWDFEHREVCFATWVVSVMLASVAAVYASEPVRILHQCGGWNAGARFSRPLGIYFDVNREECYVADTGNHQVVVCDRDGNPIYRFNHYLARDGVTILGEPKSIVVDARGRIFLTDARASHVDILDPTGRSIGSVYPPDDECDGEESFEHLALGPDGVYAALSCPKRRVAVIDDELGIARIVDLQWTGESELSCLTSIAVDEQGGIHITDACASTMVQAYDADGRLVKAFGRHDNGYENFSFPAGIALMRDGSMWVLDTSRQLASAFDSGGAYRTSIGGKGSEPGEFEYPSGLTTDGLGRLFVIERGGKRYQCFRVNDSGTESDLGLRHQ